MFETAIAEEQPIANIPTALIYEMDEGHPIYYKGYLDVLNKTKTFDEIVSCSILQSLLILNAPVFSF